MLPPNWFNTAINKDVRTLIWDRHIDFDTSEIGSKHQSKPWMINEAITLPRKYNNKNNKNHFFGLGLLNWEAHTAALRVGWLLKYRNAAESPWKQVLDQWFARTYLKRGAIFSSLSTKSLTAHLLPEIDEGDCPSSIPPFWKQALLDIRSLKLTPLKNISRLGIASQPLWYNPYFKMPPHARQYQTAWEHLQACTLDHTHHQGRLYTQEELESYLSSDQGVEWQRDHTHIKITFNDNTHSTPTIYTKHGTP
jgi:hypothetical protein